MAGPEAWVADPETWLAMADAWLDRYEACPLLRLALLALISLLLFSLTHFPLILSLFSPFFVQRPQ